MDEDQLIDGCLGYIARSHLDDRVWVPVLIDTSIVDMLNAGGLRRVKAWMRGECSCEIVWVSNGDDRWYAMPMS